jgi:hypothetical protein
MRVKELIHTNTMGISVDEDDFVKTLQSEGVVCPISGDGLQRLLQLRGVDAPVVSERVYYAYWKWHPTPGYNTTIAYDDGEFAVETSEPDPRYVQLQACAYELIVFRLDE